MAIELESAKLHDTIFSVGDKIQYRNIPASVIKITVNLFTIQTDEGLTLAWGCKYAADMVKRGVLRHVENDE